jgi:hypothetical protein
MTCCGPATLFGRRVWIVELNASELRRATDFADWLATQKRGVVADDHHEGRAAAIQVDTGWQWNELGAQGEIVVAKVLGVEAPLTRNKRRAFTEPDIPPWWSVKTQLATSRDMLDAYMRLREGSFRPGWRHVLVERDAGIWGGFVFIVHGWVTDARARAVAVRRYSYSTNQFVHARHLAPLTRELYDTVHGAPTDEPPPPAPFDRDDDAGEQLTMGVDR